MPPQNTAPQTQYTSPPEPSQMPVSSPPQQAAKPQQALQTGMFSGRLGRLGFLLCAFYILLFMAVPTGIALLNRGNTAANIIVVLWGIIGSLLAILAGLSSGIRRWHDLNKSGWFLLLSLIPIVGWITIIIQLFIPGTKGPNNYGPEDHRPNTPKKVLFGK